MNTVFVVCLWHAYEDDSVVDSVYTSKEAAVSYLTAQGYELEQQSYYHNRKFSKYPGLGTPYADITEFELRS